MNSIRLNQIVYSPLGKPVSLRVGLILKKGSYVLNNGAFDLIESDCILKAGESDYCSDISDRKKLVSYTLKELE
jgi:hypothetical protein